MKYSEKSAIDQDDTWKKYERVKHKFPNEEKVTIVHVLCTVNVISP